MQHAKRNLWRFVTTYTTFITLATALSGCSISNTRSSNESHQPSVSHPDSSNTAAPMSMGGSTGNATNQSPRAMEMQRHGHNVSINMYTEETHVQIAPGVTFPAWTFDGTVPGPVISLEQGDHVTLTLHNLDMTMSHSIDLHAALISPSQNFVDVAPGQSRTIVFTANLPGVYMYHCETAPMPLHIAQGMYGAIIVTPRGQQPPTFIIVQSEFYAPYDLNAVLNGEPKYVVFNGQAFQYATNPLKVKIDQPITVAFVNAGPNLFSAFHVVGTVLRDVQASGNPNNHLYDVQTYTIAPGDGALIHLRFDQAGKYAFVSHSMSSSGKGALGSFDVSD